MVFPEFNKQVLKGMQDCVKRTRLIGLQVLFGPQAKQYLPDGLEPLKLVVRLEGYPASLRHIRQLKSSSIGMHCIAAIGKCFFTHMLLLCNLCLSDCSLLQVAFLSCCIANT